MSILSRPALLRAAVGAAACLAAAGAIAAALTASPAATDPGADVEHPPATSAPAPSAVTAEPAESVMPSPTAPAAPPSASPGHLPSASETSAPGEFAPVTGDLEPEDATDLVAESLTPPDAGTAPDAEDLEALLTDLAAGSYRAELEAQWLELSANGWSYSGEPRVADLEIVALDERSDPATAEVTACIDSSEVVLLDAEGQRIGSQDDVVPRAAHLFALVRDDDTWRVTSRSFPDDPAC
ncbi:hypothetical protein N8K70_14740 [Microbacterium betulae]|uniref:ARC6 IMS domain-containing protein n=1 Tax=Microbacterium betulae TaxID=2981139 RepID=A0AA97FGT6_9MICO|nr:hypothetical protein [Microbacterium sp. AB]WOF22633.1 hypothetical protein N8K70_14740 [Microbacterium sp. AB]